MDINRSASNDRRTERLTCLIFCRLSRWLVSSRQLWALPCWWRHARRELQTVIDCGATCSLSRLSATTRQEFMTLDRLIWHSEHFIRQKYLVVWPWYLSDCAESSMLTTFVVFLFWVIKHCKSEQSEKTDIALCAVISYHLKDSPTEVLADVWHH